MPEVETKLLLFTAARLDCKEVKAEVGGVKGLWGGRGCAD
jgi:hypothetical protein